MNDKTKVLIVDDHVVLRDGLANILNRQPDFEVVGEAGTAEDAIAKAAKLNPDLIIMDIGLPGKNGVEATREILDNQPDIQIIMLTIHSSDQLLLEAIRSGAKGYLLKNTSADKLIASLRALKQGEAALSRQMTSRIIEELASINHSHPAADPILSQLTTREIEILRHVSSGASNKEIAERLFISVNTVKNHVHDILSKLELKNRREATLFAIRHGLDDSGSR